MPSWPAQEEYYLSRSQSRHMPLFPPLGSSPPPPPPLPPSSRSVITVLSTEPLCKQSLVPSSQLISSHTHLTSSHLASPLLSCHLKSCHLLCSALLSVCSACVAFCFVSSRLDSLHLASFDQRHGDGEMDRASGLHALESVPALSDSSTGLHLCVISWI